MAAKRLLVSLEENIFDEIENLAKANRVSLSKIAKNLIISSLELEDDKAMSGLADKRLEDTKEWISHADAWK